MKVDQSGILVGVLAAQMPQGVSRDGTDAHSTVRKVPAELSDVRGAEGWFVELLNFKTGIDFGATGNLNEFSPVGFSLPPDVVSTWSEAAVAELTFRLPPLRHDVRFVIEVFPYLADGLIAAQGCWVFLNGLFVHYSTVKTPVELIFTVSRARLNPGANRLSFALPNATAPKDLALGNDLRLLGLGFVKLTAGPP